MIHAILVHDGSDWENRLCREVVAKLLPEDSDPVPYPIYLYRIPPCPRDYDPKRSNKITLIDLTKVNNLPDALATATQPTIDRYAEIQAQKHKGKLTHLLTTDKGCSVRIVFEDGSTSDYELPENCSITIQNED